MNSIEGQYIDSCGKLRMVRYKNINIFVSPSLPLDAKMVEYPKKGHTLKELIASKIEIIEQNISDEKISGCWVSTFLGKGYVVIDDKIQKMENIPVSDKTPPVILSNKSYLEDFRNKKILANYLKEYALFSYVKNPSFKIKIVESHNYENMLKLNKRLFMEGNDIIYDKNGNFLVKSERDKKSILSFIESVILNKPSLLDEYKDTKILLSHYQSISDFNQRPGQLIFTDISGITKWMLNKNREKYIGNISGEIIRDPEPYFIKRQDIAENDIVLLQLTSNIQEAVYISDYWNKNRINLGTADVPKDYDQKNYVIYENGTHRLMSQTKTSIRNLPAILIHDKTNIFAILRINSP